MLKSVILRGVLIVSILAVFFLPAYTALYLYPTITRFLTGLLEEEARRDALHMASHLETGKGVLQKDSVAPSTAKEITEFKEDFDISKVRVYSPSGEVIYSTSSDEIGQVNENNYFHEVVAEGRFYSKLVEKEEESLEGVKMSVDVVETYVPIMDDGRFIGAFEIYYEITDRKNHFLGLIRKSSLAVFFVTSSFMLALTLAAMKARRNILRQSRDSEILRSNRDALEDQVELRTSELHEINARLRLEIADREKAVALMKESQEKFRDIFENAMDPILLADSESRFIDVNKSAEDVFGYSREAFLKMSMFDVIPSFQAHQPQRNHDEFKGQGFFRNFVEKMRTKDGRWLDIEVNSSAIVKDGRIVWTCHIVRDITVRKKLEEDMARMRNLEALGTLAGGIAHDFNNILTSILGNVSLSKALSKSNTRVTKRLTIAEEGSLRAKDLTAQLLALAQGDISHNWTTSLSKFISTSAEFILTGSDVECKYSLPDDLWPANVNPAQMSQVIQNLLLNAREAMPDGGTISISGRNMEVKENELLPLKKGRYIHISIADTGFGIPRENIKKIFNPYFSTKERGARKGMGLGLSICHSIIQNHKGKITVESEDDGLTTFNIFLPASKNMTSPI